MRNERTGCFRGSGGAQPHSQPIPPRRLNPRRPTCRGPRSRALQRYQTPTRVHTRGMNWLNVLLHCLSHSMRKPHASEAAVVAVAPPGLAPCQLQDLLLRRQLERRAVHRVATAKVPRVGAQALAERIHVVRHVLQIADVVAVVRAPVDERRVREVTRRARRARGGEMGVRETSKKYPPTGVGTFGETGVWMKRGVAGTGVGTGGRHTCAGAPRWSG